MSSQLVPRDRVNGRSTADAGLSTLLSRLNQDATSLIRDELELAKLEVRDVASAVSSDVHDAKTTLVKDLTKVGVALSLALLAGMALTACAIMGVGVLVGAYWAGALIVGVVLLVRRRGLWQERRRRHEEQRRAPIRANQEHAAAGQAGPEGRGAPDEGLRPARGSRVQGERDELTVSGTRAERNL
jgi:hypothetical protein